MWSFPISSVCSMLMMLAYYRWGNWRQAHMLPTRQTEPAIKAPPETSENTSVDADALLNNASNCERIVMPAEVGGQPPSPVANQAQAVDKS